MSSQDELIKTAVMAFLAGVAAGFSWAMSMAPKKTEWEVEYRKDGTKKKERKKTWSHKPAETAEAMAKLWDQLAKSLGVPVSAIVSVTQVKLPLKPA